MADERRVRVMTWNVHGFVGADGRWDPQRTAEVLHEIGPDLAALQEVDARSYPESEQHPLDILAEKLDANAVPGPTLGVPGRDYGNAVLSRLPIVEICRYDISQPGAEPRGAVDIRVRHCGSSVRFLASHLGLRRGERLVQATRLAAELERRSESADVVVVAGDLNAWWPRAREARILERAAGPSPTPRTFPSKRPLLRLDRVFVRPPKAVVGWGVADNPRARSASDHLPLWVDLEFT